MKYMGSKRSMLSNGLGKILLEQTSGADQFADLFVGSGAVAWYVAEATPTRVVAADLQTYATVLAEAVIGRDNPQNADYIWAGWSSRAESYLQGASFKQASDCFEKTDWLTSPVEVVETARNLCATADGLTITQAYGGYYFSPKQSLSIDALIATLPTSPEQRSLALAALVQAASGCVASPGHTAQPFKPTETAKRFLFEAWGRDVFFQTQRALSLMAVRHAQSPGRSQVADAKLVAAELTGRDVAFIDPPYSGVHYSRFYHVLETIATGKCSPVSGEGRYPPSDERPKSDFSITSKSKEALNALLATLAERKVKTILTFPQEKTSNGLSGNIVEEVASEHFRIAKTVVNGRFSTLGGNSIHRSARMPAYEIILVMKPR